MSELRLEVKNVVGIHGWRWVLTNPAGELLATREVKLDAWLDHTEAAFELDMHLRRNAVPDRREEDEWRMVDEMGAWLGEVVLGSEVCDVIVKSAAQPITVRVIIPVSAEQLQLLPLDLAHIQGRPALFSGVRFVFQIDEEAPPRAEPVSGRLRLLALFSLPPKDSPLNLREERRMLQTLVRRLRGNLGLGVELRVLQYGVTRDELRNALEDGEGWDIIHFSGHGMPGTLVLEAPDGGSDLISSGEVVEMMRPAASRLKLVTLSACLSGAGNIEKALVNIGMAATVPSTPSVVWAPRATCETTVPVARAISKALDCAVLAMRYSVEDDFAIALSKAVYEGLFVKRQSLPHALQTALTKIIGTAAGTTSGKSPRSALSIATPALFGSPAVGLKLIPPPAASNDLPSLKLAYFPPEVPYLVGRVAAMTRASAALAPESGKTAVLLHGMAGGGKTSCAIELAYHHAAAHRFRSFVWYEAPQEGGDIVLALRDFALALENQLPDFEMVHIIDDVKALRAWLPRLSELLENYGALIVLDNIESLVSSDGEWLDERWALIMQALLRPDALSRVILTSRTRPRDLLETEIIPVHALPLVEAVLLMRALPNLAALLEGSAEDRELFRRILRLVQGHPKLIHLAEGLAARKPQLAAQLDRAEQEASETDLDAFLNQGETLYEVSEFTETLHSWTRNIVASLPPAARTCFQFICLVEEPDREFQVLSLNWRDVLARLERLDLHSEFKDVVAPLLEAGLVEKQANGDDNENFIIAVHPAVAEAGRSDAGSDLEDAVNLEMTATWMYWMNVAQQRYGQMPHAGELIVRAGLAAFPYLRRTGKWAAAGAMLDTVLNFEASPAVIAAALPRARIILDAVRGGATEIPARASLGTILFLAGKTSEAEETLRDALALAVKEKNYINASTISASLINLLRSAGRLDEALAACQKLTRYAKKSGLGVWTRLGYEAIRLQVLNHLGHYRQALNKLKKLSQQMEGYDASNDSNERMSPWNVRETLLDVGREASYSLQDWSRGLEFSKAIFKSKSDRNAPPLDLALSEFNEHGPLIALGRHDEARRLLMSCRRVFENENAVGPLGKALAGLARIERKEGRHQTAQRLDEAALRLLYAAGESRAIAIGHSSIARDIRTTGGDWGDILAHWSAAALLNILIGRAAAQRDTMMLTEAVVIAQSLGVVDRPDSFSKICERVGQLSGVRFQELAIGLAKQTGDDPDTRVAELYEMVDFLKSKLRDSDEPPA